MITCAEQGFSTRQHPCEVLGRTRRGRGWARYSRWPAKAFRQARTRCPRAFPRRLSTNRGIEFHRRRPGKQSRGCAILSYIKPHWPYNRAAALSTHVRDSSTSSRRWRPKPSARPITRLQGLADTGSARRFCPATEVRENGDSRPYMGLNQATR